MKSIHIYNEEGQTVCSKEFEENDINEIEVPNNFYEIDKKLFCPKCAVYTGKPYFTCEDFHEMDIDEDKYLDTPEYLDLT